MKVNNSKKLSFLFLIFIFNKSLCKKENFIIGAWLPFWRSTNTIETTKKYLTYFNQLSQFSYRIDKFGNIIDYFKDGWQNDKINEFVNDKIEWQKLFKLARSQKIKLIPTIFSENIHNLRKCLSTEQRRSWHVNKIFYKITKEKFNGVNIDYEMLKDKDLDNFLKFIQKLSKKFHQNKLELHCSIFARWSDNSTLSLISDHKNNLNLLKRYKTTLAKYCDQIDIMTYNEISVQPQDLHLSHKYYISHTSDQWVKKCIEYALTFIPKNKLIICIPTYGLEYYIDPTQHPIYSKRIGYTLYNKAIDMAKEHDVTPHRTKGGELSFTYHIDDKLRYICFMDSIAIKNKIDLAKNYKTKGIYLFALYGEEDEDMWQYLDKNYLNN